jgi:uncharacterized protein YndB with AHSA1/START domain
VNAAPMTPEQIVAPIAAPRAAADLDAGFILATVEVLGRPERVFEALTSPEVTRWWMRPGVFDTRTWEGDASVGGRWRATGVGPAGPYTLDGEFLEVEPPRRLVQTWNDPQWPRSASTFSYDLTPTPSGTRITLRHEGGFALPVICANTCLGWESSFARLAELFAAAEHR